jgi:RHS repeat-associated protein
MGTTYFHWDPIDDCVTHESDGSGNTIVTYNREPGQFGPLISETRGGSTYTHHYDALGSTTRLTDGSGNVTDTFQYDAWGNSVARTGTTPTWYGWNGRYGASSDLQHVLLYSRARTYSATTSRWDSRDPLWPLAEHDMYVYVLSNPILLFDPAGLKCAVCKSRILWRTRVDDRDDEVFGRPYRRRATLEVEAVNRSFDPDLHLKYTRWDATGLKANFFRFENKTLGFPASLDFFFFIDFDICELPYPPGVCKLFLDETGTTTTLVTADGRRFVHEGSDQGDVTRENTSGADLRRPNPPCDARLIFSDTPGGTYNRTLESFSKKLRQVLQVRDSVTDEVVKELKNDLDFYVTKAVAFSPAPDELFYSPR